MSKTPKTTTIYYYELNASRFHYCDTKSVPVLPNEFTCKPLQVKETSKQYERLFRDYNYHSRDIIKRTEIGIVKSNNDEGYDPYCFGVYLDKRDDQKAKGLIRTYIDTVIERLESEICSQLAYISHLECNNWTDCTEPVH